MRLRALRSDLIDSTIAVHHGRIVKRNGDGSIIEFRSVVDAVRSPIEVQSGLAERNAGLPPEKRLEFRVGIHLGDVVEESDGDLMGDGSTWPHAWSASPSRARSASPSKPTGRSRDGSISRSTTSATLSSRTSPNSGCRPRRPGRKDITNRD